MVVGDIYIDPSDKDVIKITKIIKIIDEVEFDIIKDPRGVWKGNDGGWWYLSCVLHDYVPVGELSDALYE